MRRLEVNDFADQPIFQDGVWKVVQVIDKQVMTKQSYEESREIIKAELVRLKLNELAEKIDAADGYILVSPEYNHSMSPALAFGALPGALIGLVGVAAASWLLRAHPQPRRGK